MKLGWPRVTGRPTMILIALLCAGAALPLVAQGPAGATSPAGAGVAPVNAQAPLPGPRLRPQWRRVESSFADQGSATSTSSSDSHTITMSTLVLVLVVIIAVLLIAR